MNHRQAIELYEKYALRARHKRLKKFLIAVAKFSAVLSMLIGALFLSPVLTGRVIDNLTRRNANAVGISLFILGLVVYYFLSRRK